MQLKSHVSCSISSVLDGLALRDESRQLSQSCADIPLVSAETYLNRYKNGWMASSIGAKQFYDECAKRKGRPSATGGPAPLPLSEVPVPVPIPKFAWPQVRPLRFPFPWKKSLEWQALPVGNMLLEHLATEAVPGIIAQGSGS